MGTSMFGKLGIWSEKLHSCGASIAAVRSAAQLSSVSEHVDFIFEKGDGISATKAIFPQLHYIHVRNQHTQAYFGIAQRSNYDAAIFHNFLHNYGVVESAASLMPTLWMMHDVSPVTGINYAMRSRKGDKIVAYPLRSRSPSRPDTFSKLARRPFAFTAPSVWLQKIAQQYLGDDIDVFLVRNSVPSQYFQPLGKVESRRVLGLPQDKLIVLFFAGRGAIERKNLALAMQAAKRVTSDQVLFVVIGGIQPNDASWSPNVLYLPGFQAQQQPLFPAQLYSAADIFLSPSLVDNLPNTVLESLNCGTPVIGANTGGMPEMIRDRETGWLIDPRDDEGLANLLDSLVGQHGQLETMGMRGREFALNEFSEAGSLAQYVNALEKVSDLAPRNYAQNKDNQNYVKVEKRHPLHVQHDEPFYDVRGAARSKLSSIVRNRGAKADSHIAPYRDKWNPDPAEKRLLAFRYRMASEGHAITRNEARINRWYNHDKGKRAFLIGNGPSLNKCDLSLLRNEITIGVNSIFLKTEELGGLPTHYVVEDNFVAEDRAAEINALTGTNKWFGNYLNYSLSGDDVHWLNVRMRYDSYPGFPYFSTDIARQAWTGGSVTYLCMQLAFFLGIKELYLIGFDHHYEVPKDTVIDGLKYTSTSDDPNHFDPTYFGKGLRWHAPMTERMELGYDRARRMYERFGRKIYNATVGGHLEVFERVDYASLFSSTEETE